MGYKNIKAVWGLGHEGRLLKPRGGQVALHTTALNMLVYMASHAYDWPPTDELRRRKLACRCYSLGWEHMADDFGITLAGGEKAAKILAEGGNLEAMRTARKTTALNRLSQTAKFLQKQGLIKLLIPADVRREQPAVWLLLLGDAKENAEVESWARECLGLR
ncbi:hypothetical protein GFD21_06865 [Bifidobacterium sp. SMA15]|uniref:Uncharacterized protein n=2 Tax=Bifidobacterium platyrrhinorum TaxID=2661628 RepID=A0A6L9SSL7_9BIFI|nr:hypothetical protein [Bifidobacterium platyrrhinorum]